MTDPILPKEAFNKCKQAWELIQKDTLTFIVAVFLGTLAASFTGGILSGAVSAGLIKAVRKLQTGAKVEYTDAFGQMSKLVPTLLFSLLLSLLFSVVVVVDIVLSLLCGLLIAKVPVAGIIIAIILILAMIAVTLVVSLLLSVVYSIGIVLITEEDMGPVDAFKKAVEWMKKKKGTTVEFLISQFLCYLITLIPVVGAYFSYGMFLNVSVLYYDEEKAAGAL